MSDHSSALIKPVTMASTSTSQTLTKRASDSALMPPPPPPKRIKRPAKVIDEDTYTDALSHIIARDFFPGLVEIESKQDYLNALDSQDHDWIAAAGRKLTEVMTPGPDGRRHRGRRGTSMTPMSDLYGRGGETPKAWQGDTPMSVASAVSAVSIETSTTEKPGVDTKLSLSAFQAKYTSEDNESFYKLLDKQNLKKAEKYSWMWAGNKIASQRQIAHRRREANLLAIKTAQETTDGGKQLLSIEPPDVRKAMPDAWPVHPDNSLMFSPPLLSDSAPTVQQTAESASRAPPKAVIYDNTRFAPQSTSSISEPPPSPSLSAIQDALAGHPRPTASEVSFSHSPSTPRVNGYSFVDSAPSPSPSELSSPSSSGWGTSGSMSLLGAGDSTPNPFSIKDKSKREALHHRMVDKVARAKRVGKRESELRTPVPRFASSPRVAKGGLTPAAQRLLGKVGGGAGGWDSSGIKRRLETTGADGMKRSKLRLG